MPGFPRTHLPRALSSRTLSPQVFPLPVEGTETTVMTDNPAVMNYMIQLSESLEQVRDGV